MPVASLTTAIAGESKTTSKEARLLKAGRFLTVAQVADELGISTKHVRRAITAGELPVHRFGRAVRIARDDLERYVDRHRE